MAERTCKKCARVTWCEGDLSKCDFDEEPHQNRQAELCDDFLPLNDPPRTCSDKVKAQMESRLEDIRLMIAPKHSDVRLCDDGTLDTVLTVDGDHEIRFNSDEIGDFRDEETGALDLAELLENEGGVWDTIQEEMEERYHEFGLCLDYQTPNEGGGYLCFLISTGGPHEEIRFYLDALLHCYRITFVLKDWGDHAEVEIKGDELLTAEGMFRDWEECETVSGLVEQAKSSL